MRIIAEPPIFHNNGAPYTIRDFIFGLISRCVQFTRDFDAIQSAERIKKSPLKLLENDWLLLCEAAKRPSGGYPISPAHRLVTYVQTILDARDDTPIPLPEPEEVFLEVSDSPEVVLSAEEISEPGVKGLSVREQTSHELTPIGVQCRVCQREFNIPAPPTDCEGPFRIFCDTCPHVWEVDNLDQNSPPYPREEIIPPTSRSQQ